MSLFRSVMSSLSRRRSRLPLDTLVPRMKPENKSDAPEPEPKPKPQIKPAPKPRPRRRLWAGLALPFPRFGKEDEE